MATLGVMYGTGAASPSEIVGALPPGWSVCWLVENDALSVPLHRVLEQSGPVHCWRDFLTTRAPTELDAVTTFCDPMVFPAALVRQQLNLRGTSVEAARLLTDKFLQRQRLAHAGLEETSCLPARVPGELSSALDSVGLPAVIKPRTSVGSAYTFLIRSKDELDQAVANIPPAVWASGGMVVEPELAGRGPSDVGLADYVSVETLSTEGRHVPVAVTGRLALAPPFRERGGVMPAGLRQADLRLVTELAVKALEAIGVSDGVAHVEIKLQADSAGVIEVNGRLGGHIAWLWKRIGGGDLVALEIGAACHTGTAWPEPVGDVIAFRYLLPAPLTVGRVSAVTGVAQVRELPGVELVQLRARRGTVVDWREGTGSYVVLVSGATSTYESMHQCVERIESLIRIDLDDIDEAELIDESRRDMRFQVLESLRDLDAQEFDRLDVSCGPVGSYSRLVQLERDYRWSTEYLCARESGVLLAAVPFYRLRKGTWPDPSYNPATWGVGLLTAPDDVTMIGGRSGLLSCLHVAPAVSGTRRHMRLIEELLTRESRTALLLPFLTEKELGPWKGVLGSRLECHELGADARFDCHLAGEAVSRRVRQTLSRDLRMAERYGVESSIHAWSEVRSFAAGLIAHNNQAKGLPDAGQLVDFRIRQWEACEGVSVVVLAASARGERGVVVCVIWRDWIDIQEMGITGARSDVRRTLYAQLLFHLPVQLARQRGGVRHIRAGIKAEQAKVIRGASLIPLTGAAFSFTPRYDSRSNA